MLLALFILLAALVTPLAAFAQQDEPPADAAPPPLKVISKDERKLLYDQSNLKKRTQLSLDLMETRLKNAEQFAATEKFQDSINELGGFQALLENALSYLNHNDNGSDKIDYNFKRLEIGLRRTVARLEIVRRGLPFKYGFYVQKLQKVVREARAAALEPLFDDSATQRKQ